MLGLALGALLTYGWVGLENAATTGRSAVAEQVLIIVAVAVAALLAVRRSRARVVPVSTTDDSREESVPR